MKLIRRSRFFRSLFTGSERIPKQANSDMRHSEPELQKYGRRVSKVPQAMIIIFPQSCFQPVFRLP
jgi:hypothetical protein